MQVCHCDPPDSALNYLFPTTLSTVPVKASSGTPQPAEGIVVYDGAGLGSDVELAKAGLKCGRALTDKQIRSTISWLIQTGRSGFFATGARDPDRAGTYYRGTGGATPLDTELNNLKIDDIRFMRTRLTLPLTRWNEIRRTRGVELAKLLAKVSNNPHVRLQSDVLYWSNDLQQLLAQETVVHDMVQLLLAIVFITLYMWLYFDFNLFLALLAISQISLSFPIMAFLVDIILRQRPLSVFAGCSLFVVTGVSADNIFVVHETWAQAYSLKVGGRRATIEHRIRWTIAQAVRPLLIADVTTAFALFVNCLSPIPAIYQFGACGGLLILINFALVLIYMPALLVLSERGWLRAGRLCLVLYERDANHHDRAAVLRAKAQHAIHGRLFRFRWLLIAVFLALAAALFPSSLRLLGARTGDELELFGSAATPPANDLIWNSRLTSDGGAAQRLPVAFENHLGLGWSYGMPELSHALWPAGASLLSSFLLIDAIALSAYGLHRFVRHRTRLNQSGQVARTRFHCDSACIVALLVASGFATFGGFVVAWHDDTNLALNSLGCDHPIYLNAVLATALALQAVLFGALSAFLLSKTLQRFRITLTLQRRILKGRLAGFAAVAHCVAFVVVIYYMQDPHQSRTTSGQTSITGTPSQHPWSALWPGALLMVLLVCWSILFFTHAWVCIRSLKKPDFAFVIWHLRPPSSVSEQKNVLHFRAFAVCGVVTLCTGITLLVLSGNQRVLSYAAARITLGSLLILTSLLPFALAKISWDVRAWWVLQPTDWSLHNRKQATAVYVAAGILLFSFAITVFAVGNGSAGQDPEGGRTNSQPGSPAEWDAGWPEVAIFFLFSYWSLFAWMAAFVSYRGKSLGPLAPSHARRSFKRALVFSICGLLCLSSAVSLLLLGGFDVVHHQSMRNALGVCLLVTILPHIIMLLSLTQKRQYGMLRPYLITHAAVSVGFHAVTIFALFILSLGAFDVLKLHRFATALGLLLLLDSTCLLAIVSVISRRVSLGCLRHLGPPSASFYDVSAATDHIQGLSNREICTVAISTILALLCLLAGMFASIVAMWPLGLDETIGNQGAAISLGAVLVCHTPPLAVLGIVLFLGRPLGIFQPTSRSRRSNGPWVITCCFAITFLATGVHLLKSHSLSSDQTSTAQSQLGSASSSSGGDPDGMLVVSAVVSLMEALLVFGAAKAQAAGKRWLIIHPSIEYRRAPLRAPALISVGTMMVCICIFSLYLAWQVRWHDVLWRVRAIPIFIELQLVAHAATSAVALRQIIHKQGKVLGIFELKHTNMAACTLAACFAVATGLSLAVSFTTRARSHGLRRRASGGDLEAGAAILLLIQSSLLIAVLPMMYGSEQKGVYQLGRIRSSIVTARGNWSTKKVELLERVPRRLCIAVVAILGAGWALCYVEAVIVESGTITLHHAEGSVMPPRPWVSLIVTGTLLLLHLPLAACLADVALSGEAFAGFGLPPPIAPVGELKPKPQARDTDSSLAYQHGPEAYPTCTADSAPHGAPATAASSAVNRQPNFGVLMISLMCVMASVGSACVHFSLNAIVIKPSQGALAFGEEAPIRVAESCELVWGIEDHLQRSPSSSLWLGWRNVEGTAFYANLMPTYQPELASAQVEMDALCRLLQTSQSVRQRYLVNSPLHSAPLSSCLPASFRQWVERRAVGNASSILTEWPVPPEHYLTLLLAFLSDEPRFKSHIGFTSNLPRRVAWMKISINSRYATGLGNSDVLTNPERFRQYRDSFSDMFLALPVSVRAFANAAHADQFASGELDESSQQPGSGELFPPYDTASLALLSSLSNSVLALGWPSCKQFSLAPTVEAFLSGVTRAVMLTPTFSIAALFAFLHDVFLSYAALYTIICMIVTVMGIMQQLGLTLGPIESLSFAVVIGVSVDYLAHFAYAYKNTLMREHYFKTRAVFLARSGSVSASAVTTLCAVLPLVGAQLMPLRTFGVIFVIVAVVAFIFSMGFFNALLMVFGPGEPLSKDARGRRRQVTRTTRNASSSFDAKSKLNSATHEGTQAAADPSACTQSDTRVGLRERAPVRI